MAEKTARVEEAESPDVCPHVNCNDVRCSSRFRLGRLEQAFSVCFGSYHGCPMYHQINGEYSPNLVSEAVPIITITARGVALRPTGS